MNPYDLAAKTTKAIDETVAEEMETNVFEGTLDSRDKVQVLNYLRTVRTHIELIEYLVTHDATKI